VVLMHVFLLALMMWLVIGKLDCVAVFTSGFEASIVPFHVHAISVA
jgi:hypothetical protein